MPCGVIDAAVISVDDCNGAPRVRSAIAKNNAMAIAAGLRWRAIFVFIGIRFYLFLRENFSTVAKILETRISVAH